jgi:hypothetical protein
MPELIPVTYAKLRAELAAELAPGSRATDLVIADDAMRVLVDADGRLPRVVPAEGEPIWRAAIRDARERGATDAELLGWAGERRVDSGRSRLLLRAALGGVGVLAPGNRLVPMHEVLSGEDAELVRIALQHRD